MTQELLKKYIEGNASLEEKEKVISWVKADKKNMSELLAIRKLHDITLWQSVEMKNDNQKKSNHKTTLIYRITSIAAVLFLLISLSIYILYIKQQIPDVMMQTIQVPAGQRVELFLTDGTSVWLNAGTTFTFPNNFDRKKREVIIEGEGYFNVEKDEDKPFIVKTSSYDVKVLGTEFNVMAYKQSSFFEVSLIKGGVEISGNNNQDKVILEPNTRAYMENDRLQKGIIEHYDYLLWKDGVISFDDEPVDLMVSKLELYFDTRILIENESFKQKKYTGKFRTKDGIEHILKVFQLKDKFTYEKNDIENTITIK